MASKNPLSSRERRSILFLFTLIVASMAAAFLLRRAEAAPEAPAPASADTVRILVPDSAYSSPRRKAGKKGKKKKKEKKGKKESAPGPSRDILNEYND